MEQKTCSMCKEIKPVSDFNKRSRNTCGLRSECRDCQKEKNNIYYHEKGGRYKTQEYYIRNREAKLLKMHYSFRPRDYDPLKAPAHMAVYTAIKNGQITRPDTCPKCGTKGKIEAHHHNGYDKDHYLDVVWVCRTCHDLLDHPDFAKLLNRRGLCTNKSL